VERVGGDGVLVVEIEGAVLVDQRDGRTPVQPAVGRAVDDDGGVVAGRGGQRAVVGGAVGGEGHPGVARPQVRTAHAGRRARHGDLYPGALVQDAGVDAAGTAVAPAVLLVSG